jgi:hypothetical protein
LNEYGHNSGEWYSPGYYSSAGYYNDGQVFREHVKRGEEEAYNPVQKAIDDALKHNGTELRVIHVALDGTALADTTHYLDGSTKDNSVVSVPFTG